MVLTRAATKQAAGGDGGKPAARPGSAAPAPAADLGAVLALVALAAVRPRRRPPP